MAKIKTYANDNTINANDKLIGTDFNDSDKTKNYLISELKNYILNGLDTRPYKVYTALLSQTGTNAPIATVLENTLGGTVVWSYVDIGTFSGITTGKFLNNKTYLYINSASETGNMLDGLAGVSKISEDEINVITVSSGADVSNDILNQASIEIRVYN
ncbi:DUF285 domain-containing protein [Flavobacterium phage vB_FspP_elemoA_8-9A]|jgi:hypothetical protein|uniref:DUF285 domain-containing protein n=2 Tax=Elemovirus TaxID=2948694 RepID=A0A7D7FB52_9CAUD|nr:DUF285 domain-containing protein [Flavobacterium phage vB_FspP_elemoF_6-3D]YP_010356512.1 DUF285 domain-containing protein [Flavobacterium phage vB_FspP_elemoC_14-1A]QMP84784.1 DUF285 domain-containing protein [Flavobacterium phage vB_FspP_elemoC_13-1C]QMP86667.1 DUF285 domain-containing protein [Flavobacterium phage vB_FspP_elemoA_13-1B]QMP87665.1 DUF285 domain-containing protein [Flavobacterium phage vB_FspP_elemoC_15-9A]QMP88458.1 DUF285 domain-containing protein [Flavobacterium phage vB